MVSLKSIQGLLIDPFSILPSPFLLNHHTDSTLQLQLVALKQKFLHTFSAKNVEPNCNLINFKQAKNQDYTSFQTDRQSL